MLIVVELEPSISSTNELTIEFVTDVDSGSEMGIRVGLTSPVAAVLDEMNVIV